LRSRRREGRIRHPTAPIVPPHRSGGVAAAWAPATGAAPRGRLRRGVAIGDARRRRSRRFPVGRARAARVKFRGTGRYGTSRSFRNESRDCEPRLSTLPMSALDHRPSFNGSRLENLAQVRRPRRRRRDQRAVLKLKQYRPAGCLPLPTPP
jgi:hypothetical protein